MIDRVTGSTDPAYLADMLPPLNEFALGLVYGVLAEMDGLFEPVEDRRILKLIAVLDVLPRRKEGEVGGKLIAAAFTGVLRGMPAWCINRAVNEIIRTDEWFPAPARVHDLAQHHLNKAHWRRAVLQGWTSVPQKELPDPNANRIKPEEVDEANELMRHYRLRTRYHRDGTMFQLAEHEKDPTALPRTSSRRPQNDRHYTPSVQAPPRHHCCSATLMGRLPRRNRIASAPLR